MARGHVTQRSPGSWSIVLDIGTNPTTGQRKQQRVTVKGTKRDAEKRLAEMLHQLDTGLFVKPEKQTLSAFLSQWLNDCKVNLSPRSYESYEYIVNKHIIPSLGQVPLTSLRSQDIQRLYTDKMASGLSNRTVIYIHTALHKSLANAVKMRTIARNPCDGVTPPRLVRHEMKTMSPADVNNLLELARKTPYYSLFFLLLTTGLRRSEALALKWSDINLLGLELSVNRTIHRLANNEMIISQPKTEKSRRTISISTATGIVLREHKGTQEKNFQMVGKTLSEDDFVFCDIYGKPYLPNTVTHAFGKLAKRSGLNGIHLHSARHTMASLMLKLNVHPLVVSRMLGHSNIQTTLTVYSHVTPGLEAAACVQLDKLLSPETRVSSTAP